MSTVTLSLAEPASEWLAQRVASGEWPSREAYVADLIARDREEAEREAALHAALDEGREQRRQRTDHRRDFRGGHGLATCMSRARPSHTAQAAVRIIDL